jgi:uncharacterized protein YqgC (DUF456 family)
VQVRKRYRKIDEIPVALPMLYWPLVGLMLVCYLTVTQLAKTWFVRRYGAN